MVMKILKSIGLYFVYPLIVFLLGILFHWWFMDYFYPNKYDKISKEDIFMEESVLEVSDSLEKITTCDTQCLIIEKDLNTGNEKEIKQQLPDKYWGMTRTMLEYALKEYEVSPTLEDQEKGFVSISLDKFSGSQVTISKKYRLTEDNSGYYLMVQDGKIVVMEEDKRTVYLSTDIYVEALSDTLKKELILGKFIYSMDELYGFLESYTS